MGSTYGRRTIIQIRSVVCFAIFVLIYVHFIYQRPLSLATYNNGLDDVTEQDLWNSTVTSSSATFSSIPVPSSSKIVSETSSPFIAWLQSRGLRTERVVFITLGDVNYVPALHNLRDRLDQWGYGGDLVVLCLDQYCAEYGAFHGYAGFTTQSVASMKFSASLDLAQHGYNFVFLDGDVYLTGSHDPLANMLPLSNDTWDIQFQPDNDGASLNIGWYFAKATAATVKFFRRSYARWNETSDWDQSVMNDLGWRMEFEEHSLRVNHLHGPYYKNFMLYNWQHDLFASSEEATQHFINESTLIHYTCIEQSLKTYFGRNFGGFGDLQHYYSRPPPLIATANISGLVSSIHAQTVFAAQLAASTNRTMIWPNTVDMVQKREMEDVNHTSLLHQPRFPGIRAISYPSAQRAGIDVVEGRYLANKALYSPPLEQVIFDIAEYLSTPDVGISALKKALLDLSSTQVAVLDFAHFGPRLFYGDDSTTTTTDTQNITEKYSSETLTSLEERWLTDSFDKTGIKNFTAPLFDKIKACRKANWEAGCLDNCE